MLLCMALAFPMSVWGNHSGGNRAVELRFTNQGPHKVSKEVGSLGMHSFSNLECVMQPDMTVTSDSDFFEKIRMGEEGYVTVTPKLDAYPSKGIYPRIAYAISCEDQSEKYFCEWWEGDLMFPFSIPMGKYDFIFFFWGDFYQGCDGIRCIIKEEVNIIEDMEIEALPSEATEHIVFNAFLANGERPTTDIGGIDENGNWGVISEGNCVQINYYTQFTYKGEDLQLFFANPFDTLTDQNERVSGSHFMDVWVSDNESGKIGVYQKCTPLQEDGCSIIVIGANGTITQEVSNDVENYTLPVSAKWVENRYKPEEASEYYDPYANSTFGYYTFNDGIAITDNWSVVMNDNSWNGSKYRICLDPVNAPEITVAPQFWTIQYQKEYMKKGGIVAPLYSFETDEWQPIHQTWFFTDNNFINYLNFTADRSYGYPTSPWLVISNSDEIVFGDNTPITVFLRPTEIFDYGFVGRYGEMRTIDKFNSNISVKCNGEEVWNATDGFNLNEFAQSEESKKPGPWTIDIDDSNVVVDNLQSHSHCEMNFREGEKEHTPTLVHLMMRTEDGKVSDRFDENDGDLIFYAGVFKCNFSPWPWFSYEPLEDVLVEYAPYGDQNYSAFKVVEDPEKFFMPGYGAYYSGSLSQVDRKSATGWYDVRISLYDSHGNSQVQTISPAFKINSLTGISEIEVDYDVKIIGNNIIAPKGSRVYTIDGIEIGSTNLPNGIYIVVMQNRCYKIEIQ